VEAPRFDPGVECLFETLEAFGVFGDRSDIFAADNLLSRRRTDDLCEPPQVGRTPGGPACRADILAQSERLEAKFGRLEVTDGIFPSPAEVADRFIFHVRDMDGCEIT
jgi:hypothetical protein